MELFHLSFRKFKKEFWTPRKPWGDFDENSEDETIPSKCGFSEPSFKRICFSDTIEGAYYAVYSNICKFFKDKLYRYIDYYVYTPTITESTKLILPKELTEKRWVWDAHFTKEYNITTPVEVELWGKVRFFNNEKEECLTTHPFNDVLLPKEQIAPPAKYKVLTRRT